MWIGMVRKRTFKIDISPVPDRWRRIALMRKTIQVWPEWSEVTPLAAKKTGSTQDRDDLNTNAAETIELIVPLSDEHGVGLEGVRLSITAWPYRKLEDITALLEVPGGRSFTNIARVDGWPLDPHMNLRSRNYPGLGHLLPEVIGHHVHRFDDNARLGLDAFGAENLPLAAPITQRLESYRDFLRVVGAEFNIDGTDQLVPPDWSTLF
jgi:hypothetical protein